MQFMLLLKGDIALNPETSRPEVAFDPSKLINAMQKYSQELTDAGVLLAAEGLQPSAHGARVVYRNGKRTVVDGPFAEAKELVAGFYLIDVKSKAEAIEWAARCPVHHAATGDQEAVVEVRGIGSAAETYPELANP